jgi:predicted AAA+ superfamily ATPase
MTAINEERKWIDRIVEPRLQEGMSHFPALLISGPRAVGKSSLARRVTKGLLALDVPANAAAAKVDPDGLLVRQEFPLTIDEWQEAPQILGAVKRMIDSGLPNGQVLITGSSDASNRDLLWPGTGRWMEIKLFGLTQREIVGASFNLLEELTKSSLDFGKVANSDHSVKDYLTLALKSGYPNVALSEIPSSFVSEHLRATAHTSCSRDAASLGLDVDSSKLYSYLRAMAATVAQMPTDASLHQAAQVSAPSASKYESALTQVGLVSRVPAWSTNALTRLSKASKITFLDTGLMAAVNGWSLDDLELDGGKRGQVIENFVIQQIRSEAENLGLTLHHLRNSSGTHEIDLLLEDRNGALVAIEIKASQLVDDDDAKHLRWLQKEHPAKIKAAIVFYAGRYPLKLKDGVLAIPISALWQN